MASRASSEAPASGAAVEIPALPGLGTGWYERGARYWARRVATAVFFLAVLAMVCWISLALYAGFISGVSSTVRTAANWVQGAGAVVAAGWGWTRQRRDLRKQLLDPPTPGQAWDARRNSSGRVPGRVALGRGLVLFLAPVMPMVAAWLVGWTVAMLTVREYPSEVGARRWLQERTS
ncbi:hypothetical protein [Streptomyces sp. YU58]|uniref:hypothetical protein n=1 Tax=Streptomyces sp. SX92 TaxID=3158972 RepID=UPI0027BA96C4|nr:hypothetical protein [Streptomyces coralus]WLW54177.1 hypothetical protein QU709_23715 [Streptomyces coralus]